MTSLAIIGGGNMGGAIASAAAAAARRPFDRVIVAETDAAKLAALVAGSDSRIEGSRSACDAIEAAGGDSVIVLAVKPQMFVTLAQELIQRGEEGVCRLRGQLVVSIMAGITTARLAELLGSACSSPATRFVRAMPNLALARGCGMTAVCAGPSATDADVELITDLFRTMGDATCIEEPLMDAFTALAGSGPAYVFHLAEAMQRAAIAVGFDAEAADRIVRQTILGAADLLAHEHGATGKGRSGGRSASLLKAAVTSKGGTTEAALAVLDRRETAEALIEAITAARDRGRELARPAT
ncbi:MAG: pyrroline-5-carboxylate reductase [Phycisphaerales bacterium]|nr:pyrroline-5-carboxylate reductase [Phycisphaerales bacterium]